MLWLGDADCHDPLRVGGKAANLSLLLGRFPVPPGFCIATDVFARLSGDVVSLPAALRDEMSAAYVLLGRRCGQHEPSVAVRSSASDEDGASASYAGQLETLLNVVGDEALARAIVQCYRSVWSSRVSSYRGARGISGRPLASVLVQWLVPADVSGVAFSLDPITSDGANVVINAAWGLGESIVSGTVTPDTLVVTKGTLRVAERLLGDKGVMTVVVPGGTQEAPVPREMQERLCLDDTRAAEVACLTAALEEAMGWAVDVEWAYHDAKLYLLQCRPITTAS